jgi:tetratricopeptide (TPR) repeat protein
MDRAESNGLLAEAIKSYQAGQPERARSFCDTILQADPNHVDASHLAAVIECASGRFAEGIVLLRRVLALQPGNAQAFSTLGDALAMQGRHDEAIIAFQHVAALKPDDPSTHVKLGIEFAGRKEWEQAIAAYRTAIRCDQGYQRAHFNLGIALAEAGNLSEAANAYRGALSINPGWIDPTLNLGNILLGREQHDEAISLYQNALVIHPKDSRLHQNLAAALFARCRFGEAAKALRDAIEIEPREAKLHYKLGLALLELDEFEQAIPAFAQTVAIEHDHPTAYTRLGLALERADRFDEAVMAYRKATDVNSGSSETLAASLQRLATSLWVLGQFDEALAAASRLIDLEPDVALHQMHRAFFLLTNGDYEKGFEQFESRRKLDGWKKLHVSSTRSQPTWRGEDLEGRILLLDSEQGFGDTLHFIRFARIVVARGVKVIVRIPTELGDLFRTMPGLQIVTFDEPLPAFDVHLPLMSLPHVLGTRVETIPADVPYITPDPQKCASWRQRFGAAPGLKVGIVWSGNPQLHGDRDRSLPSSALLPKLVLPGIRLFSLQKALRPADAPTLAALGSGLTDLAPWLDDFSETAAAVAELDLVITVDTAVAHLAGALGRPAWVLLPFVPDWRWLRDREDSPWYPTLRLFRQSQRGQWAPVVDRITRELKQFGAHYELAS